jgi:hypothetical protein
MKARRDRNSNPHQASRLDKRRQTMDSGLSTGGSCHTLRKLPPRARLEPDFCGPQLTA